MLLHDIAQQVAGGEMHELQRRRDERGLRAFAGALRTDQHHVTHRRHWVLSPCPGQRNAAPDGRGVAAGCR